ncbi:MAG TPA: cold shock domain-containing protein [Candidatus Limnocylindria bacterium]
MASGTIKKLVSDRGFGFIAEDGGSEIFFHRSQVADDRFDSLKEGQKVTFERGKDPRSARDRAEKVTPTD